VLAITDVDLADLALALEDHAPDHVWLLDPAAGTIEPRFGPRDGDEDGAVTIDPLPVAVGYGDMEDFVAYVRDPRARDLLERAIVGRGAFRRFKDALAAYPELRRAWFAFHDARGERRAIEWLVDHGLVDARVADAELAARTDPEPGDLPGLLDAEGLTRRVTRDLRRVYKTRLRSVALTGAWARGEAHPEAAVELVVVLDAFADRWAERRRMERALWRHSVRDGVVVTALPVREGELDAAAAGPWDDRAQRDIAAARLLLEHGFCGQAIARAADAAMAAAQAALIGTGAVPETPAGIVAAFNQHLVVEGDMRPEHARALRRLYEDRATAAHVLDPEAPEAEAREAVAAAEAVLAACAAVTPGAPA
jgi:uncharacterized protein (UPF0332 family)